MTTTNQLIISANEFDDKTSRIERFQSLEVGTYWQAKMEP